MKSTYMLKVEGDMRPAIADVHRWDRISEIEDRPVHMIHRINVPESARGKGHGTTLLKEIIEDADQEGVMLILGPSPSGGLDFDQLVAWYERYGFTWTRSGAMMERMPNGK